MSDIEKAFDAIIEKGKHKHPCRVHEVISQISEDHGEAVAEKFAELSGSKAYPVQSVILTLREHGYRLGKDAVARHRKRGSTGGCECI